MKYRPVKGMPDILPDESRRFQRLERIFRETVEAYGFQELRTPLLERLALFHKSTGETSEVVQKQMFALEKSGEMLALRPEGTPSSARAYIDNKMHAKEPITKWFYIGPMFRAENVQRGRQRQFHQAGCELYGDTGPHCDAELIDMLYQMCERLELKGVSIQVNSLGGSEARVAYRKKLQEFFQPRVDGLSDHAKARLQDNPLRILDSKDPRDIEASEGAPILLDCLTDDDKAHFEGLQKALERLGTPFEVAPRLVRGLDYYTRTCFEFAASTGEIGSQSAILGGGRYDAMLEGLGGQPTPAIGFAMGLERILLALGDHDVPRAPLVFVAPLGEEAQFEAVALAQAIRKSGVVTEVDCRGNSLKSMLRRADGMGARLCVVLGKNELKEQRVQVKDLAAHEQHDVAIPDLVSRVETLLATPADEASE